MGYKNREIEVKLLVEDERVALTEVVAMMDAIFEKRSIKVLREKSTDIYWKTSRASRADFARVRQLENGKVQLTVKATDRGCNFDRIEIDCVVEEKKQAVALLDTLVGAREGVVTKKYHVYFIEHGENEHDEGTTVCVYKVDGSPYIFLEIEGPTKNCVVELCEEILARCPFQLSRVRSSLFQIFVEKKAIKKQPLKSGKVRSMLRSVR